MARVPFIEPSETTGELRTLYEGIELLFGRVVNLWRLLGHSPDLMKYFAPLSVAIQRKDYLSLDQDLKRLAVLRTSWLNECHYCVSHNTDFALAQGIPAAKIDALKQEPLDETPFSAIELAVLHWSDAVTHNTAKQDRESFAALEEHFNTQEIVELTVTIAHRNMINRIQESLWNDLEPEDFPASGLQRPADADLDPLSQWIQHVHTS